MPVGPPGPAFGQVPYGQAPYGQAPYGAPYGQAPYGAPYGVPYGQVPYPGTAVYGRDPGSGFSVTAIVLGLVGLLILPIVMGPVAIGFAIAAMVKRQRMRVVALCVAIGGPAVGAVLGMVVFGLMHRYR